MLWRREQYRLEEFELAASENSALLFGIQVIAVDARNGEIIARKEVRARGPVVRVGRVFYVATDRSILGLDENLRVVLEVDTGDRPLAWTMDKAVGAVATSDAFLVFDVTAGEVTTRLSVPGRNAAIMALGLSDDVLVASHSNTIEGWSIKKGIRLWQCDQVAPLAGVTIWGDKLIVNDTRALKTRVLSDGSPVQSVNVDHAISGVVKIEILGGSAFAGIGRTKVISKLGPTIHLRRITPGICVIDMNKAKSANHWIDDAEGAVTAMCNNGVYIIVATSEGWLIALQRPVTGIVDH